MNKLVTILAGCAMLSACQQPAPPAPVSTAYPKSAHGSPYGTARLHHPVHKKLPGNTPVELASDCAWPAHAHVSTATRLDSSTSQAPVGATPTPAAAVEGCAVLRFSLSKTGAVSWIEVVSAKPETIAPLALKCLLAARFKPDPHPDPVSMIRVDVRTLQPNVVVAALKVR